jgi:TonB family protein
VALRAILGSFALHAGLAVTLSVGSGGHALPGRPGPAPPMDLLEIETAEETVELPEPETVPELEPAPRGAPSPPRPLHTHPYAVPETHDAHPHDPSASHGPHEHAGDVDPRADAPAAAVASAPAKLPVFSMSSHGATLTAGSTRVARGGSGAGEDVAPTTTTYAANAVSVAARLVASAPAAYPSDARADDVEGDVALEIVVDAEGHVVDARVTSPAGRGFDASALAAIRSYRFSAAQREGRPVRVRMPWTVRFRLR